MNAEIRGPVRILVVGVVISLVVAFLAPPVVGTVAPYVLAWLLT